MNGSSSQDSLRTPVEAEGVGSNLACNFACHCVSSANPATPGNASHSVLRGGR